MALTLVTTAGAADANSYITRADADTYIASRLNTTAWDDADDPNVALAEATRLLDLCVFKGYRSADTQALQWPRTNAIDPDAPGYGTWYFDTDEIPQRIKYACVDLALEFLRAGTTDINVPDDKGEVVSERVDVLQTTYQPRTALYGLARYPHVLDRIRPLLQNNGGGYTSSIVRG